MALIQLYREFLRQGIQPDVCTANFRSNDTRCFGDISIKSLEETNIQEYDVLLVVRSVFDDLLPLSDIMSYKGLIVADNTTLYDGDDVYGDLVFTSGCRNYTSLTRSNVVLPTRSAGCLKVTEAHKGKQASKKIVWIESGHFPYGTEGRKQEAALIQQICRAFPEYEVVIKPRYLRAECMDVKHSNGEHLFYYLDDVCRAVSNLKLLEEPCVLADVIADAQTIIHTYSSAFQEAVLLEKGIINIGDFISEETSDLREHRYARIREYIDKAGCTCSQAEVLGYLPEGMKCSESYQTEILGNRVSPAEFMVKAICEAANQWKKNCALPARFFEDVIESDYENVNEEKVRAQRMMGWRRHCMSRYEYFFDDWNLFDGFEVENIEDEKWEEKLCVWVKNKFEHLNENRFNQVYLMKMAYESGEFDPQGWPNLLCEEAFLYFSGKYWVDHGEPDRAISCFERYLEKLEGRLYPRTWIETPEYQRDARSAIKGQRSMTCSKPPGL